MTKVELQPPVRLSDFVASGKLELSLRQYLELVMANNTEIQIQKLAVETPRNQILRAHGTFDPIFTGSFNNRRTKTPSTDALQGANTVVQLNQPANFSYQQTLATGTQYTATFTASKNSTNSGFQNFNPALNSNMGLSFTQPLLRNRGSYVNRIAIMMAQSRLRKSEYDTRTQLLTLVSDAETVYWNLINSRENLQGAAERAGSGARSAEARAAGAGTGRDVAARHFRPGAARGRGRNRRFPGGVPVAAGRGRAAPADRRRPRPGRPQAAYRADRDGGPRRHRHHRPRNAGGKSAGACART